MLRTINYAIFKCMECGNTIKVQPSQSVEVIQCECKPKQEPKAEKPKTTRKPKPKAKESKDGETL